VVTVSFNVSGPGPHTRSTHLLVALVCRTSAEDNASLLATCD
jgi:hypothetical protein